MFQVRGPNPGIGAKPPKKLIPPAPMGDHPAMDWGVWPPDNDDTKKGDYQVASWGGRTDQRSRLPISHSSSPRDFPAARALLRDAEVVRPLPDDDSILPIIQRNDRTDTPRFSWYLHWRPSRAAPEVGRGERAVAESRPQLPRLHQLHRRPNRAHSRGGEKEGDRGDNTSSLSGGTMGASRREGDTGKNTPLGSGDEVPLIFAGPGVTAGQTLHPAGGIA